MRGCLVYLVGLIRLPGAVGVGASLHMSGEGWGDGLPTSTSRLEDWAVLEVLIDISCRISFFIRWVHRGQLSIRNDAEAMDPAIQVNWNVLF